MLLEKFVISEDSFREFCFREICRQRKCFRESVVQSLFNNAATNTYSQYKLTQNLENLSKKLRMQREISTN